MNKTGMIEDLMPATKVDKCTQVKKHGFFRICALLVMLCCQFVLVGCANSAQNDVNNNEAVSADKSSSDGSKSSSKDKGLAAEDGQNPAETDEPGVNSADTTRGAIDGQRDLAKAAVTTYFLLLSSGNYRSALNFHGAGFETLKAWNAEVEDKTELLKKGCTLNGLKCLPIRDIDAGKQLSPGEYEFRVTFMNTDGTKFVPPLVEGESAEKSAERGLFIFHAGLSGQGYVVQELPPYVS